MVNSNRTRGLLSAATCVTALLSIELAVGEPAYEMGAYTNRPGGRQLLAGNYDAAIESASSTIWSRNETDALVAQTNLCVAHTVKREFTEAYDACDEALTLAKRADRSYARLRRSEMAKALTNRGVLRAISGDAIGAARDFREAAGLGSKWSAPSRNLAHLESSAAYRLAVAQASSD